MSCSLQVFKEEPESPLNYNEVTLDATLYLTPLDEFGAKLEANLAVSGYKEEAEIASHDDDDDEVLADLEELISIEFKELIKDEPLLFDGHILDEVEAPRAIPVSIPD